MSKQDVADFIDVLAARIVELEAENADLKRSRLDIIHVKEETILDRDRQIATLRHLGDDMAATGTGFADFVAARKAWRENR